MTSLAYLIPGTGLDEEEPSRRERVANELVREEVRVLVPDRGPRSIESAVEEEWAAVAILRLIEAHEEEFDAFVIGCFGDPGLAGARELTDRPVVGPAMASFHTAAQVADRFSCLTILDSTVPLTRRLVASSGLEDRLASLRVVDAPVLDIDHGSKELVQRMIEAGQAAVEEDGAEALVPGCMSLAFMRVHEEVAEAVGVPFIDPVGVALETAATWARHGIAPSSRTYPSADRSRLEELFDATGP